MEFVKNVLSVQYSIFSLRISNKETSTSHFGMENKSDGCLYKIIKHSCLNVDDSRKLYLRPCSTLHSWDDRTDNDSVPLIPLHIGTDILGTRNVLDPFHLQRPEMQ